MNDLVNDEALVKLQRLDLGVWRISDQIRNVIVSCDEHDFLRGVKESENQSPVMRMSDLVQNLNPKRSLQNDVTAAEAFEGMAGGGTHQTAFIR
jgi:hypothetical protein